MDDKKADKLTQTYPNWLNWFFAVFFVAMTVIAFVPDSSQWRYFPFTAFMAFTFIKKGKEKRVWELGERLVMPILCFSFVVGFIQGVADNAETSTLWYNGGATILCVLTSVFDIYIKPRLKTYK